MNNERQFITVENSEYDLAEAQAFYDLHVREYTEEEFETYLRAQCEQWKEQAWRAESDHAPIRAMWLKRNAGGGTYFGAVIDYVVPMREGFQAYAMIGIHSESGPTEIELYLPSQDGSEEPVRVMNEAYSLEALDRTIQLVESYYE